MLKSILPDAYAIAPKTSVEIAVKPVAYPSNPSVKLTAFDVAVIIINIRGIYKILKSKNPFAINGRDIEDKGIETNELSKFTK